MMIIRYAISSGGIAFGLFGPAPVCVALESNGCATYVDGVGNPVTKGLKSTARGKFKEYLHEIGVMTEMATALLDIKLPEVDNGVGMSLSWSAFAEKVCLSWVRAAALSSDPVLPSMLLEDSVLPPRGLRASIANSAVAMMRLQDLAEVSPAPLAGRISGMDDDFQPFIAYVTHRFIVCATSDMISPVAGYAWHRTAKPGEVDVHSDLSELELASFRITQDDFLYYTLRGRNDRDADVLRCTTLLLTMLASLFTKSHASEGVALRLSELTAPVEHIFPIAYLPSHVLGGNIKAAGLAAQYFRGASSTSPSPADDAEYFVRPCTTPTRGWEDVSVSREEVFASRSLEFSVQSENSPPAGVAYASPSPSKRPAYVEAALQRNASLLAQLDREMRTW